MSELQLSNKLELLFSHDEYARRSQLRRINETDLERKVPLQTEEDRWRVKNASVLVKCHCTRYVRVLLPPFLRFCHVASRLSSFLSPRYQSRYRDIQDERALARLARTKITGYLHNIMRVSRDAERFRWAERKWRRNRSPTTHPDVFPLVFPSNSSVISRGNCIPWPGHEWLDRWLDQRCV